MPNGKTHDTITKVSILPLFLIGCLALSYLSILIDINNPIVFLSIIITNILAYMFSSFMFNGDLDTNSNVYNRWWIFKMIWIPYQIMFSHRSIFTHGIIIGTLIRIIYLLIWFIPLYLILPNKTINLIEYLYNNHLIYIISIYIGLETGNIIHTLSDKIYSTFK